MANSLKDGIGEFDKGMRKKSQEVKAKQNHGEIVVSMTKVVFKIVAMVFEGVMTLILIFPASPTGADDLGHSLV